MRFIEGMLDIVTRVAAVQAGRAQARDWADLKPQRAWDRINPFLSDMVARDQSAAVRAALQQLGELITDADSLERHTEVSELLWQVKERLQQELGARGLTLQDFLESVEPTTQSSAA